MGIPADLRLPCSKHLEVTGWARRVSGSAALNGADANSTAHKLLPVAALFLAAVRL